MGAKTISNGWKRNQEHKNQNLWRCLESKPMGRLNISNGLWELRDYHWMAIHTCEIFNKSSSGGDKWVWSMILEYVVALLNVAWINEDWIMCRCTRMKLENLYKGGSWELQHLKQISEAWFNISSSLDKFSTPTTNYYKWTTSHSSQVYIIWGGKNTLDHPTRNNYGWTTLHLSHEFVNMATKFNNMCGFCKD